MNCKGVPDPISKQITLKYIKTQYRKKRKEKKLIKMDKPLRNHQEIS